MNKSGTSAQKNRIRVENYYYNFTEIRFFFFSFPLSYLMKEKKTGITLHGITITVNEGKSKD